MSSVVFILACACVLCYACQLQALAFQMLSPVVSVRQQVYRWQWMPAPQTSSTHEQIVRLIHQAIHCDEPSPVRLRLHCTILSHFPGIDSSVRSLLPKNSWVMECILGIHHEPPISTKPFTFFSSAPLFRRHSPRGPSAVTGHPWVSSPCCSLDGA